MSGHGGSDAAGERRVSLAIFSVLWAVGAILHLAKWSLWVESPANLAIAVAAALVLLRPGDLVPLAGLFGAQVWALAGEMPRTSNHLHLSGLIGLLGLLALALGLARRGGRPDPAGFMRDFAPPARAVALLVLLIAGFSKLNADWFRPGVSCGAALWSTIAGRIPGVPDAGWARSGAIVAGIGVEFVAPALLLSRRLRAWGLWLAGAFLFLVGAGGFFNFAAIFGALLFLFAPANPRELAAAARDRWPALGHVVAVARSAAARRIRRVSPAIVAGAAILIALSRPWDGPHAAPLLVREVASVNRPAISYAFEAGWWAYCALIAAALAAGLRAGSPRWPAARELLAHPAPSLAVVPLLVLALGIAPYFGLRTEATFAMFSNLRTERGSNHLLVRRPIDLLGLQADLVRIESSSDPELRRLAGLGYLLPWTELVAYVRARSRAAGPDFAVTYERGGRRRAVERAGRDPELTRQAPLAVRKLVVFRPVWIGERNPCRH